MKQCDATGAIWIIFDRSDLRLNAIFIAFEIDYSVTRFISAAAIKRGDAASGISPTGFADRGSELSIRLALGHLFVTGRDREAAARRSRFVLFGRHGFRYSALGVRYS